MVVSSGSINLFLVSLQVQIVWTFDGTKNKSTDPDDTIILEEPKCACWKFKDRDDTILQVYGSRCLLWEFRDLDYTIRQV